MPVTYTSTYEPPILRVATKMEPKIRKAFLDAVDAVRQQLGSGGLVRALRSGDVNQVLAIVSIDERFVKALQGSGLEPGVRSVRDAVQQTFAAGAQVAIKELPRKVGIELSFNLISQEAVNFLNSYSFDLIQDISAQTRRGIQRVLADSFRTGASTEEQARAIRDLIGLTDTQDLAVRSYRDALRTGDLRNALNRELRDARFDRTLERALSEGTAIDRSRIATMVDRYRASYIQYRAEAIARTESVRAAQAGQNEAWRQAQAQGLLNLDQMRVWIVAGDDRTCPRCRAMKNKSAPLNGTFPGGISGPPLHTTCRCSTRLQDSRSRTAA